MVVQIELRQYLSYNLWRKEIKSLSSNTLHITGHFGDNYRYTSY
jgi:hypothetical protein